MSGASPQPPLFLPSRRLAGWLFVGLAHSIAAHAATEIRAGEILHIRLTSQVCSRSSKVGDRVTAVVLGRAGGQVDDPLAGTELSGSVVETQSVGIGIRHSRARLHIKFDALQLPDGAQVPLRLRVVAVDNARETVDREGTIHGIEAGDGPASLINNRWIHVPSFTSFSLYTNVGIIAYKLVTPFFPDPEIHYAAGTEMAVLVSEPGQPAVVVGAGAVRPAVRLEREPPDDLQRYLEQLAVRTHRNGGRPADFINLLFVGSEADLTEAFRIAGWANSRPLGLASAAHSFAAVLERRYYEGTSVSLQTFENQPPAMVWQKGLNDQAKRHHTRVWKLPEGYRGRETWAAAATRDVAAGLRLQPVEFYHHIETDIDQERSKVVRDLVATGCVTSVSLVRRNWVPGTALNSTGDEMTTDGQAAVIALGSCRADAAIALPSTPESHIHHGSFLDRFARKDILTFRYDLLKANAIYGSYEIGRALWHNVHHNGIHDSIDASRRSPHPPKPAASIAGAVSPTARLHRTLHSGLSPNHSG